MDSDSGQNDLSTIDELEGIESACRASGSGSGRNVSKTRKAFDILVLAYGSLGSIYGDIGTSPLYVLNTVLPSQTVTVEETYGAVSCIFWVFTLIVIVKYCFVVLKLGPNNGEGGQVAIYCKLSRILKTGPTGVVIPGDDEEDDMTLLTRSETKDSRMSSESRTNKFINNPKFRMCFSRGSMLLCFFGCALVIGDGLLTPTTSVLSAISGISMAVPSFSSKVMPVSVCILLGLFLMQPIGIQYISIMFSPIIAIWFITIFVVGVYNISSHPIIFKSLNPKMAVDFLRMQKGIDVLGSVMLSITGCEAMFADVGHFSPLAVQITLSVVVYPCLMVNYLGQGAYLVHHPDKIANVFYNSVPGKVGGGFYWYVFVLSTLATIIASEALILGCFSILRQMMVIECFPRFRVIHQSAKHHGQIFIPVINFFLMVAVVCTCVGFKSSSNVTSAYGLGVSLDLFITTLFISATMVIVYKIHWIVGLFFFFVFGSLEMCLIVANMKKVPQGAWFTLMVAGIVFFFIVLWRWGINALLTQNLKHRARLSSLISRKAHESLSFTPGALSRSEPQSSEELLVRLGDRRTVVLSRHEGIGFMLTDIRILLGYPNSVPGLFKVILGSFPSLPSTFVFAVVRIATIPYVDDSERVLIQPMPALEGLFRCVIRFGFMDKIKMSPRITDEILSRIWEFHFSSSDISREEFFSHQPLNILQCNCILGRKIEPSETRGSFRWLKKLIIKSIIFSRSFYVERFFSPLYHLQSEPALVLSNNSGCSDRIIYLGEEIML